MSGRTSAHQERRADELLNAEIDAGCGVRHAGFRIIRAYNPPTLTTSLSVGARLGPYEVVSPLGAGGMGQVFRARDTRLNRNVAIKVLPELFAADPERLSRFDREAKTLASLNHPNIAHIYGTEHAGATLALVMELVEGEDLSQRIGRGAIPVDEALEIARQIADGLQAAHEQGIVHRDLKPGNVKLRPDGVVKVLDFGLAKAIAPDPVAAVQLNSPTFTSPATQLGVVLGTAAYMAPEQARGRPVDRRADVWAFGCVLYEMLTAKCLFLGDDTSMTLAAILKQDVDLAALPAETPASVRRLLRRCLEKDPRRRLHSMADASLELDDVEPAEAGAPIAVRPVRGWQPLVMGAAAGALVTAIAFGGVLLARRTRSEGAPVVRSQIAFPGFPLRLANFRTFALNPAGTELVFSGFRAEGGYQLFRRLLNDDRVTPITGTEGAAEPFFSPDGQWLTFVQSQRLRRMPAGGGAAVDLAEVAGSQGGSYAPDGSLVFNPQHGEGLLRVVPGARPAAITTVEADSGQAGHHWPQVLPGGTHVLYTVEVDGKDYSDAQIVIAALDGSDRRVLIAGGTDARYIPTGHILYWRSGSLWAVPFDVSTRQLTGSAVVALPDVMSGEANGQAHYSVAANGTIAYLSGRDTQQERGLMLVDRSGVARPLTDDRYAFEEPVVSPDGRRIVITITAANDSQWMLDVGRTTLTRITYEAENSFPVWSPDGTRLAFARTQRGEPRQLFLMPSDGSTAPRLLQKSSRPEWPHTWTANGDMLAYVRQESTGNDIWIVNMSGEPKPRPLVATRFDEGLPRISPDGRWMAYVSNESGRPEVYVRPFPGPGQKRLVSSGGGGEPRWRGDGRELFYRNGELVMAADVTTSPELTVSVPRVLFKGPYVLEQHWSTWDVLPDGKHFVMIQNFAQPRAAVILVQNWFTELKAKFASRP